MKNVLLAALVASYLLNCDEPRLKLQVPGKEVPVNAETAKSPRVTKYTKMWTDDYHNDHKVVFSAYTTTLNDETGDEVTVEVWHGTATGYHENGKKAWEVEYRKGKREGAFTSWADNGARSGTATFQRGLLHGKRDQWNSDGRKMLEETYANGKADGETRYWDPDGKVVTTGTNRDGKPWEGTFPELSSPPGESSWWVIRRYEEGKKVSEQKLTGHWWW